MLILLSEQLAGILFRIQQLLTGILPALLSPKEMIELIHTHYNRSYHDAEARAPEAWYKWTLESWEAAVLADHLMKTGTILVLGAGGGRESFALAQRGFSVVGLDINRESLHVAARHAKANHLRPLFAQADFLALPIGPGRLDYVFMSGIMYSSIPGRPQRQAWLRGLRPCLQDQGLLVLNFLIARGIETRTHRLIHRLNRWLTTLPGTNQSYQLGDTCSQHHFLHAFLDEEEIRSELLEAGTTVRQLHWHEGYAVLSWPANGLTPPRATGA